MSRKTHGISKSLPNTGNFAKTQGKTGSFVSLIPKFPDSKNHGCYDICSDIFQFNPKN